MSNIIIEQIPAVRGQPGESVVLSGAYLPDKGVTHPLTQRIVKHHLPGARVPTVQVLGPERGAVMMRGRFHDGTTGDVDGALSMTRRLSALAEAGLLVRLVWERGGQNVWDMTGIITRFNAAWEDRTIVAWELEVEPIEIGDIMRQKVRAQFAQQRSARDAEADLARAKTVALVAMTAQRAMLRTTLAATLAIAVAT